MNFYNEIQIKCDELDNQVRQLAKNGAEYANAYREYRILLSKELLELKANKMPVTIAYDIARGIDKVANAKFRELATEAIYKANLESINAIKLQIKIMQEQYNKEWGQTKYE